MNTLYEIADTYKGALNELSALLQDGDIDMAVFEDSLAALEGDFKDKSLNVCRWMESIKAQAEAIKSAEKKMAERRKKLEAEHSAYFRYLHQNMVKCGISEIDSPEIALKIKGKAPSLVITGDVPEKFINRKVTESPDKAAIKKELKNGPLDFAKLGDDTTRLVIE